VPDGAGFSESGSDQSKRKLRHSHSGFIAPVCISDQLMVCLSPALLTKFFFPEDLASFP